MKKWNLAATFLGCALCTILMVGATYEPQPCFTGAIEEDRTSIVAESSVDEKPAVTVATEETAVETANETVTPPAPNEAAAPVAVETEKQESVKNTSDDEPKPAAQTTSSPEVKKTNQKSTASKKTSAQDESKIVSSADDPGGNNNSAKKEGSASAAPEKVSSKTCTITIDGVEMSYIDSYGTSSAPDSNAGIWRGSDSTTDGSFGYFIGHNTTDFGVVADINDGAVVSVTDGNGDSRSYEVVDSFVVPEGSYWSDISDRVTGHGESIVMQTCVEGGYRIVVAE